MWPNTDVHMENVVNSHHDKTDYQLYLHKVPEQRRAPSGNPWDSLERGYAEVNGFYRAFRRRTGHNYSDLKQLHI